MEISQDPVTVVELGNSGDNEMSGRGVASLAHSLSAYLMYRDGARKSQADAGAGAVGKFY